MTDHEQDIGFDRAMGAEDAARYELSRRVTHDVKAPIRQINQLIEILIAEQRDVLDSEALSILSLVQGKAGYLAELVEALRAYSDAHCKPLQLQEIDLVDCLQLELESLKTTNIQFRDGGPIIIHADPQLFSRLFQSLFSLHPLGLEKSAASINAIQLKRLDERHITIDISPCLFDLTGKFTLEDLVKYNSETIFEILSIHEAKEIFLRHGWGFYMEAGQKDSLQLTIRL